MEGTSRNLRYMAYMSDDMNFIRKVYLGDVLVQYFRCLLGGTQLVARVEITAKLTI
ncbi:hypothetical protein CLV60_1322 [Dyadobacter jiangsuensis]|uniref:Thioesterase superfamily protein n=1 Tax=Dyadobacter jiangsuensis TaxID=1591085 RepID=A0A2P8F977_9BACT|nr:hypothetical protein CLV60_1322 [Dyadobacter jiangsuensis]